MVINATNEQLQKYLSRNRVQDVGKVDGGYQKRWFYIDFDYGNELHTNIMTQDYLLSYQKNL